MLQVVKKETIEKTGTLVIREPISQSRGIFTYFVLPLTAPRIPAYAAGYEASRAERLRGLLGRRRG